MPSLDVILEWLAAYKYVAIFPIGVLEGPMISVLGGFLVSTGVLNFFAAYVVLTLSDVAGDLVYYFFGRWGGNPFLKRWGHWIGVNQEKLMQFEEHFNLHGDKYIALSKTQAFGAAILAAAGVVKFPVLRFTLVSFLSSIPKTLFFFLIGYFFGAAYVQIEGYITKVGFIVSGICLLIAGFYIYKKRGRLW